MKDQYIGHSTFSFTKLSQMLICAVTISVYMSPKGVSLSFRKRYDTSIKDLEKKQDSHKEVLAKLQHQFQQAQVKAAAKA